MNRLRELDRIIAGKAWTSGELTDDLRYLTSLGGRYAFSDEGHDAARYITSRFKNVLRNVRQQEFDMPGWSGGECSLTNTHDSFRCRPLLNSPATSKDGVSGKIYDLGPGFKADVEQSASLMKDAIVIVSDNGRVEKRGRLHRMELIEAASNAGARAFIFSTAPPGQHFPSGSAADTGLSEIPAISMSFEESARLLDYHRRFPETNFTLRVNATTFPGKGINVIGETGPVYSSDGTILICGHYDGHRPGDAAQDNGAGIAVIMEIARMMSEIDFSDARRKLVLVAFSGEESGLMGSRYFVMHETIPLSEIRMVFNLDCPVMGGRPELGIMADDSAFPFFVGMGDEMGYPFPVRQVKSMFSDHAPFVEKGIPAIWQLSKVAPGVFNRGWGHTSADTLDKIDERELREAAMMAGMIVLRLIFSEEFPLMPRHED